MVEQSRRAKKNYVWPVGSDGNILAIDSNGKITTITEATDLDIRDLTSATDSVAIYGSDDGGTTKRIIKTDSGGALQVDLEVSNVGITGGQAADGSAVSGNPVRIGGKDGSGNTQDVITDTDGHLQIDILTSALPSGAATETTLATVAGDTTSIDGKITACNTGAVVISSGSVTETNSGSIKTAVEKIDDLQAALKSVDTDELVCRLTDSAGTEINPAKEDGNLATIAGDTTSIDGKITACDTSGLATEAGNLATIAGDTTSIDGKITACNTGAVTISAALPAGTNIIGKAHLTDGTNSIDIPEIGDAVSETDHGFVPLFKDIDNGQWKWAAVSASGYLYVMQQDAGNLVATCVGNVSSDASDLGNPVKVGGKAYNFDGTAPGTAVAENDRANFITDVYGRQFVETAHPNLWSATANYGSAQTNTAIKAAPGAGLSLFITDIVVSTDTAGSVKFLEDTASAKTDKVELMYFAANGGIAMPFKTPVKLTANKDFGITSTIAGNHSVTVNGFIGP